MKRKSKKETNGGTSWNIKTNRIKKSKRKKKNIIN